MDLASIYHDYLTEHLERSSLIRYSDLLLKNKLEELQQKNFQKPNGEEQAISSNTLIFRDLDNEVKGLIMTNTSIRLYASNSNSEFERMMEYQLNLGFIRDVEATEKLYKNWIYELMKYNPNVIIQNLKLLGKKIIDENEEPIFANLKRHNFPNGDTLYAIIKNCCGVHYTNPDSFKDFTLKDVWSAMRKIRHAIVHTESVISKKELDSSKRYERITRWYFDIIEEGNSYKLQLNRTGFHNFQRDIIEFSYAIFKRLSKNFNLRWEVFLTSEDVHINR